MQSVRAIVSEFSESAENFDEMSNEDNTHEPDDSDLVRAPMYFSKFQRCKLCYTSSIMSGAQFLIADAVVGLAVASPVGQPAVRSTELTGRPTVSVLSAKVAIPCGRGADEVSMSKYKRLLTYKSMPATETRSPQSCNGSKNPGKS